MASTKCTVCGIRNGKTGSKGTETSPHNDMCNYCFEEGGYENSHSDNNHDHIAEQHKAFLEAESKGEAKIEDYLEDAEVEELAFMEGCWICDPTLNLAKLPAKAASTTPKKQGTRRPQLNHKGHSHPQTPAARRACKALFWAQTAVKAENWDANLDGFGKPVAPVQPAQTPAKPTKAPGYTLVSTGPKHGVVKQLKAAKPTK